MKHSIITLCLSLIFCWVSQSPAWAQSPEIQEYQLNSTPALASLLQPKTATPEIQENDSAEVSWAIIGLNILTIILYTIGLVLFFAVLAVPNLARSEILMTSFLSLLVLALVQGVPYFLQGFPQEGWYLMLISNMVSFLIPIISLAAVLLLKQTGLVSNETNRTAMGDILAQIMMTLGLGLLGANLFNSVQLNIKRQQDQQLTTVSEQHPSLQLVSWQWQF